MTHSQLLIESGKIKVVEILCLVCSDSCISNDYVKIKKKRTEVPCECKFEK